jgi:hypothetical protein
MITAMDGIILTTGETTMAEIHTPDQQDDMMDEAIAQAFVAARRKLDVAHHSRLVKAWELVIDRAVTLSGDGSATVKGADQPEYTVGPSGCDCTDCTSGQAPLGFCKHVLAVALQKRSMQKFQDMGAAHGQLAADAQNSRPQDLPEAPISICLKGTLGGIPNTLVTLRGRDMREIESRADQVRAGARYLTGIFDDAPAQPAETTTAVVAVPTCPDHHTPMKPSKFGGWYCPQPMGDGESFCQQKVRPAKKRAAFVPPAANHWGGAVCPGSQTLWADAARADGADEYGLTSDNAELLEHVARALGVIR